MHAIDHYLQKKAGVPLPVGRRTLSEVRTGERLRLFRAVGFRNSITNPNIRDIPTYDEATSAKGSLPGTIPLHHTVSRRKLRWRIAPRPDLPRNHRLQQ